MFTVLTCPPPYAAPCLWAYTGSTKKGPKGTLARGGEFGQTAEGGKRLPLCIYAMLPLNFGAQKIKQVEGPILTAWGGGTNDMGGRRKPNARAFLATHRKEGSVFPWRNTQSRFYGHFDCAPGSLAATLPDVHPPRAADVAPQ